MSWGRVLLLNPVDNPEGQSTGIEHRSGFSCHQDKRVPVYASPHSLVGLDRSGTQYKPLTKL
jgi:hypothetical protein